MGFKKWFGGKKRSNTAGDEQVASAHDHPIVRALSLLEPEVAFKHGLAGSAVAGVFRSEDHSPESFVQNTGFIEVVHRVIREHAPNMPGFEQAAQHQRNGSLSIIDLRTPEGPNGNVPPEDIVGAFAVVDGRASASTYYPNPNYRVYTVNGLLKLPQPLHDILLRELRKLSTDAA